MKKQELKELRETLLRWKSHNEVHAKVADEMLYKVLDGILKLVEGDDEDEIGDESTDSVDVVNESEFFAPAGDEDGSNPPNGPGTPP